MSNTTEEASDLREHGDPSKGAAAYRYCAAPAEDGAWVPAHCEDVTVGHPGVWCEGCLAADK